MFETAEEIETKIEEEQHATKMKNSKQTKIPEDPFGIDCEMMELLSYNQMIFSPLLRDPWSLGRVHYRVTECGKESWGEGAELPAVVYEHAELQNVEFEWGTWGRAVR